MVVCDWWHGCYVCMFGFVRCCWSVFFREFVLVYSLFLGFLLCVVDIVVLPIVYFILFVVL